MSNPYRSRAELSYRDFVTNDNCFRILSKNYLQFLLMIVSTMQDFYVVRRFSEQCGLRSAFRIGLMCSVPAHCAHSVIAEARWSLISLQPCLPRETYNVNRTGVDEDLDIRLAHAGGMQASK
jgi:hypothetical protein